MSNLGSLYIVSGPSGAGKTSLCTALLESTPELHLCTSCTTRLMRPGEQDGRDYHFLDQYTFDAQREEGMFLEYAHVHGHDYGTRAADVEAARKRGENVLLEIDWQGAELVGARVMDACRIFILPPSIKILEERLKGRKQDSAETITRRVAAARSEIAHADEAEFRIVNQNFNDALFDLKAVYRAHQLRLKHLVL